MRAKTYKYALLGATALAAASAIYAPASAQVTSTAPSDQTLTNHNPASEAKVQQEAAPAEVIVTARHRNESLIDVPISISVVTSAKLEQLGLTSTTDIANYVPSLTFNNYTPGDGRNDAGPDRPIVIRGLDINGSNAGAEAAGLFLDGAAVIGNEVPASMDVGQVEVLRGPQSVYFGRATMTGAVSYRTRSIGDDWHGEIEAVVADQNERDIQATIAGPVIPGLLKLRITGLSDSYGGYEPNSFPGASEDLGATQRDSISVTAILTPAPNLEIKGYVNYFRDNDGPSATAVVPSTLANCMLPGATVATFCGQIPGKSNSIGFIDTAPTLLTPAGQGFLSYLYGSTPITKGQDFKQDVGTHRAVLNTDIVANWDINSYLKLTSITGYHTNHDVSVDDGEPEPLSPNLPAPGFGTIDNYYFNFAEERTDISQELRLTSDPEQRLSWTFGGNFIHQEQVATAAAASTYFVFAQASVPTYATTYGVFGGVYYKLTDKLSLAAEGRYQNDKITEAANADGSDILSVSTNSFSPRISAEYDIGGHRRIYASYAEGNEPAGLNTQVALQGSGLPAASQAAYFQQVASLLGGTSNAYKEETLKIGELGVKGNVFGSKGFFDLNGYYGNLDNQQIEVSAPIPALGGNSVSATNNAGAATAYGIEWQGSYNFTHDLSISTTYSWNHTERTKFFNSAGVTQFGTTDFDGKAFAFVPEFQGSAVLAYTHDIVEGWRGYGNGSVIYRGKQFVDDFNAAYIPDRYQIDLRAGVQHENYTLEIFCKNLLNDQNYTGGSVAPNYGQASNAAYSFFGGYAQPRQVGVRILGKF
jgi:iron complex outermembrane receptor protein